MTVYLTQVCTIGYTIIALSLVLFVQASNVYPQLLLGRLFFSLGGSAVSTMVTAILPTITGGNLPHQGPGHQRRSNHTWRPSLSSEITITPSRFERSRSREQIPEPAPTSSSSRLAGFVGLFAGCGALISLAVFLPLPAYFENSGSTPAQAIRQSFYVVAFVALLIAVVCFFGLRNLPGEEEKHIQSLWQDTRTAEEYSNSQSRTTTKYGKDLLHAFKLGFQHPDICLGYIGGLVARASSVAISLFIPLFINHYYRKLGLCQTAGQDNNPSGGLGDIKKSCPEAYILASILTGVSQLAALLTAPVFGYLSERSRRYNLPLLFAALLGIVGYITFPLIFNPQRKAPHVNRGEFVIVSFIGISQIGAIVCSLGILSNGVLNINSGDNLQGSGSGSSQEPTGSTQTGDEDNSHTENDPLITKPGDSLISADLKHLKGCIAGIYSLYGGAGILILTKLGGLLFDVSSTGAPFYIMAIFNGIMFLAGIGCIAWRYGKSR